MHYGCDVRVCEGQPVGASLRGRPIVDEEIVFHIELIATEGAATECRPYKFTQSDVIQTRAKASKEIVAASCLVEKGSGR
jgi:hypothetical protein